MMTASDFTALWLLSLKQMFPFELFAKLSPHNKHNGGKKSFELIRMDYVWFEFVSV